MRAPRITVREGSGDQGIDPHLVFVGVDGVPQRATQLLTLCIGRDSTLEYAQLNPRAERREEGFNTLPSPVVGDVIRDHPKGSLTAHFHKIGPYFSSDVSDRASNFACRWSATG